MTTNTQLCSTLDKLIRAALRAADPQEALRRHIRRDGESLWIDHQHYALNQFRDIRLIAVGKASLPMAEQVVALLGDKLSRGVVVTKYGHLLTMESHPTHHDPRLTLIEAAHPVPDENSLRAGEAVCDALANCTEHTLVIVCVSGGASALLVAPQEGISLNILRAINDALLRSGADIREMNAVRSRLDRLKGGGLVRRAQPATVIGLILSDVIGDPLDVIASGLTNDPHAHNVLVGNNTQACEAVAAMARDLGFVTHVVTTELRGEAREVGKQIVMELAQPSPLFLGKESGVRGTCLIYGGETTVTVHGDGKGGRNQELALAAAIELDELVARKHPSTTGFARATRSPSAQDVYHYAIASLGTDGTDGPTDAAGAIAFGDTVQRARERGLEARDYLERNDSYHFFQQLRDLIMTGPTGTNVADVVIALAVDN